MSLFTNVYFTTQNIRFVAATTRNRGTYAFLACSMPYFCTISRLNCGSITLCTTPPASMTRLRYLLSE